MSINKQASNQHSLLYVALIAALATCSGSIAAAQNDSTTESGYAQLPSITVTGYGTAQKLEDTSGSVQVVTKEQIEQENSTELKELSGKVSGLAFKSSMTGGDQRLFIRGQGDMLDMSGMRVGVIVDGVPMYQSEIQNVDLWDVERIEVLKGSQSVLYGAGASAGAINIISKKPSESGGFVHLGYGNHNRKEGGFAYDYVANDAVYLGLDTSFSKDDGFVENKHTGNKLGGADRKSLILKATLSPSDSTIIDIRTFYKKDKIDGPFTVLLDGNTLRPITGDATTMYGGTELPFWSVYQNNDSYSDADTLGGSLRISHEFAGGLTLTSTTGYTHYSLDQFADGDGGIATLNDMYADVTLNQYFQEFRLEGESEKFKWLAGAAASISKDKRDRFTYPKAPFYGTTTTTSGYGLFGQLTYSPIDSLDLTGGLRVQNDRSKAESTTAGTRAHISNSAQETNFSWSGRATWRFAPKAHVYANIATGYKPGGYYGGMHSVYNYETEKSLTEELGIKATWLNDRLFTTAAIFNTNTKNYQAIGAGVTPSGVIDVLITNAGKVQTKGFELAADFVLNEYVRLGANFMWIDPEIKDYHIAAYEGNQVPFVSNNSLNANVTFTIPTAYGKVAWRTDYTRMGKSYGDYANNFKQDAYGLLDSSLTWSYKGHQLRLWGKNLLNKEYYNYLNFMLNPMSTGQDYSVGSYGLDRTFGVSYRYKF